MATNTIKRLAQSHLTTTTATNLGSAGTTSGTMVKQINIMNMSGVSQTVELFIGSTGGSAVADEVFKAILAAGDSAAFDGMMIIPSGSFLVGKISAAASPGVVFTVHGMEMS